MSKFFSFIVTVAARSIRRLGIVANASRVPAAFVGSTGLFAAVLVGAAPSGFLPDPAAPLEASAQTPQLSGGGDAFVLSSRPDNTVSYSTNPRPGVEEIGTKLEFLLQWACFRCRACGLSGHQLSGVDPEGVVGFHPEACTKGSCSQHPTCIHTDEMVGVSKDVLSATLESLTAAAPAEITALASAFPHVVRINRDRQALQLIGCGDQIVASWSATSVPALEEILE